MNQGAFNKINDVLKDNNKIVIPDLQRDYCWGTVIAKDNKKSLAYNFTSELINEAKNQLKYQEFSYGIIYTYEYPETFLYLCDGQQRLTTLYLIIGVLNCYQNNPELTEILQLKNGQPRLKYEVRNSTDYFIKDLVNLTFNQQKINDLEDTSKTTWYRDIYKDDPSIMSIVNALRDIHKLINIDNYEQITTFLLDKVGFVYINLEAKEEGTKQTYSKIREYGEKMYEIVNTCGDPMEVNEHQKSVLLSKIPKENQKEWTAKWEIWQDFFWVHRGTQLSADEGFNEFLSWIAKIEETANYSIEIVEEYFKAFFQLINSQDKINNHRKFNIKNLKEEFLKNQKPDLMVLYPSLIYLKNSEAVKFEINKYHIDENLINYDELFRFFRFFSNISKNSEAFESAIKLAKENGANRDVTNFVKLANDELKNILSDEEIKKLTIYLNCKDSIERTQTEDKIWLAEDHNYLNGKIEPLFKWMKMINPSYQNIFILSEFEKTYQYLNELTDKNNIENLRIALLSFSKNFSDFREGWSWNVERFYLGLDNNFNFWKKWIASKEMKMIILPYSKNETIEKIISDEIAKETDLYRKTIVTFLFQKKMNTWPWNNSKRFFIYKDEICFPNGLQAKENTERRKIF